MCILVYKGKMKYNGLQCTSVNNKSLPERASTSLILFISGTLFMPSKYMQELPMIN